MSAGTSRHDPPAGLRAASGHRVAAPRDPRTAEEWQEAADAAALMLAVDSAVRYGLVRWVGPRGGYRHKQDNVDVDRCTEILARAEEIGVRPAPLSVLLTRLRQ